LKRLQSTERSTQLHGGAGSQPVSIVVFPVSQRAERGRESVNPAEMKLCPGGADNYFSAEVRILVPRKGQFSNLKTKNKIIKSKNKM